MRAFIAWTVAAALSMVLGVMLYTTSLKGSQTGYQETAASPQPVQTVVKTKTKVVRKPAKKMVVYVPQAPAPAPQSAVAPEQTSTDAGSARVSSTSSGTSASDDSGHSDDRGDDD